MENKMITIQISDYLTQELAEKIAFAEYGSKEIGWVNRITEAVYCNKNDSDYFRVIAANQDDEVVGSLCCIQNEYEPSWWYYGDLFVAKEYRQIGIAEKMVKTAIRHL